MDVVDTTGSYEDITADLGDAVERWLAETLPEETVSSWIEATFPDRLIVGIGDEESVEVWEVPYGIDGDVLAFGEPTELNVVAMTTDIPSPDGELVLMDAPKVLASAMAEKNMTRIRRRLMVMMDAIGDPSGEPQGEWGQAGGEVALAGSGTRGGSGVGAGMAAAGGQGDEVALAGTGTRKWLDGVWFLDEKADLLAPLEEKAAAACPPGDMAKTKRGKFIDRMRMAAAKGKDTPKDASDLVTAAAALLVEAKAGRVLSSANADAIRGAYESLTMVLERAGVFGAVKAENDEEDPEKLATVVDESIEVSPEDTAAMLAEFEAMKADISID